MSRGRPLLLVPYTYFNTMTSYLAFYRRDHQQDDNLIEFLIAHEYPFTATVPAVNEQRPLVAVSAPC